MDLTQYRQKLIGNDEERAVSPVIGVVLMVAITVILAAVIAAFVMDLGGDMGSEAQAGVSIDGDGTSEAQVTVDSLSSADGVYIVNPDGEYVSTDWNDTDGNISNANSLDGVGQSATLNETDVGGEGEYQVVAYIGDSPDDAETETNVQDFDLEP